MGAKGAVVSQRAREDSETAAVDGWPHGQGAADGVEVAAGPPHLRGKGTAKPLLSGRDASRREQPEAISKAHPRREFGCPSSNVERAVLPVPSSGTPSWLSSRELERPSEAAR